MEEIVPRMIKTRMWVGFAPRFALRRNNPIANSTFFELKTNIRISTRIVIDQSHNFKLCAENTKAKTAQSLWRRLIACRKSDKYRIKQL